MCQHEVRVFVIEEFWRQEWSEEIWRWLKRILLKSTINKLWLDKRLPKWEGVIEGWCINTLVLSGLMALNELLLLFLPIGTYAYISESWAMLTSDRPSSPKCVDIPRNLTLCYGIQVSKQHRKPYPSHPSFTPILSFISLIGTMQSPFAVQK